MQKTGNLSIFVKGIFLLIILFFLFGIYLSIPVLFNYKSIENIIEKKFYSNFDIKININGDIKYQLLPKPHLLIKNSSLSIDKKSGEQMSIDIESMKVFLDTNNLYPKSKISFEKLEFKENNFLIKKNEYVILRNYFHKSESKPIHIKKSKIFILDENDDTIVISPIKKLVFATSQNDNIKRLNINGNVFDLNFKSSWKKEFDSKFNSQIEIDFKNPNISIKNILNHENDQNFKGLTLINFLNKNIEVNYKFKNNKITLKSPKNNNDIQLESIIDLKPFYLNTNIFLNNQNLNFLIDDLFYSILDLKSDLIGNLNGDLKISLTNIKNEIISDGLISFKISDRSIVLNKAILNLGDVGFTESEIKYEDGDGEIIFNSSNVINIKNKRNFAKKFQLNPREVEKLDKIYFKINKNISTGLISIFDIKINKLDNSYIIKDNLPYNFRNPQEFKSVVKRILRN